MIIKVFVDKVGTFKQVYDRYEKEVGRELAKRAKKLMSEVEGMKDGS